MANDAVADTVATADVVTTDDASASVAEDTPSEPEAPQINFKMFCIPLLMLGINKAGIDLTTEDNKLYIQIAFGVAQVVTLLGYLLVLALVKMKADTTNTLVVEERKMGTGEMEKKTLTFCEYDQKQVWSKLGTMAMGVAITGGVYYKWAYIQPLLIQAVLQPLNYFTDPLFLVVVMGADATKGSNKRPWKTDKPPMFGDLQKKLNPDGEKEKEEGKERKKRGAANKQAIKSKKSN
mmetsp:Transcript_39080/g.74866  ORF Transcript_39080/g.74866 Transcript_39080/m.74866 type:complete len:236 (+) Transcript_39080:114-821(+)